MPTVTDTDSFTGVRKTAPRAVRAWAWILSIAMVLVALIGFNVASGHGRGLLMFGLLAGLFIVRLLVVAKWQK